VAFNVQKNVRTNEKITIDLKETKKRKKEIEELTKDLWN